MSMKEWLDGETSIWIEVLIFLLGGVAYGSLEILYRGHTHWTMVITGGACVLTLYLLLDWLLMQPLILGALAGAGIITFYEFIVGCIVNLRLGWNVWDYSEMGGNVLGQVCPAFTAVWFTICFLFLGLVRILALS